jgi:hypothetical protein
MDHFPPTLQLELNSGKARLVGAQMILSSVLTSHLVGRIPRPISLDIARGWSRLDAVYSGLLQHSELPGVSTDFSSDIRVAAAFALGSLTSEEQFPATPVVYVLNLDRLSTMIDNRSREFGCRSSSFLGSIPVPVSNPVDAEITVVNLQEFFGYSKRIKRQRGYFVERLGRSAVEKFLVSQGILTFYEFRLFSLAEKNEFARRVLGGRYSLSYLMAEDSVCNTLSEWAELGGWPESIDAHYERLFHGARSDPRSYWTKERIWRESGMLTWRPTRWRADRAA